MNTRYTHFLKQYHGSHLPSQCLSLSLRDGEPGHGPVVAICRARIRHGKMVTTKVESGSKHWAMDHIFQTCRRNSCTWLVAINLYDTLVRLGFFDAIDAGSWHIARKESNGTGLIVHEPGCTFLIAMRHNGGKLVAVDASNYGVCSLPGIGEYPTANAEAITKWWCDWIGWIKDHDAGSLRLTLAAQSHYAFRKNFMRAGVMVHDNEPALALEEQALYGGRCEAFVLGEVQGPMYHLDANSLYGAVAADAAMPIHLIAHHADKPGDGKCFMAAVHAIKHQTKEPCPTIPGSYGYDIIADVEIDTKQPMVPLRIPEQELTIWPIGKFRTQLCGPELDMCEDAITKVFSWSLYRTVPIFAEWARWCWDCRQTEIYNGNTVLAKQLKQWAQFFYGKFAQRQRGWTKDPNAEHYGKWSVWWEVQKNGKAPVPHRAIAGVPEVYQDGGFTSSAIPAITAWVNSLARCWLWRAIVAAGRDNVYYCDTDSLFVNEYGMESLTAAGYVVGPRLGDLHRVGKHYKVAFKGWKHYECDGQVTCAGNVASRSTAIADQIAGQQCEPLTVAASQGRSPMLIDSVLRVIPSGVYRHGKVLQNGDVKPWEIGG